MKRLLTTLLVITAGASFGCSDTNDGNKEPSNHLSQTWRCSVGETQGCYSGPAGTKGVGICKAGHKDCVDSGNGPEWTECLDEVLPDYDFPCDASNPELDSDCNGVADTRQDEDGDGLTVCDTYGRRLDCCDNDRQCFVPGVKAPNRTLRRIHDDCIGDFLDGDCDGIVDNGTRECSKEEIDAARAERCGDSVVQNFEQCDDGKENNDGRYGGCNPNCLYAHYCGDGVVNEAFGEVCDEGLGRISVIKDGKVVWVGGGTDTYGHCKSDCSGMSEAGYCGDGIVNGDEECDSGYMDEALGKRVGGDGKYGHCQANCKWAPFCGDGNIDDDPSIGAYEKCDDGLGYLVDGSGNVVGGGTGTYGDNCKPDCSGRTSWCGDGTVDEGYEDCDQAYKNQFGNYVGGDGSYNGCNENCTRAAYCGDGIVQGREECDYGTYGNQGFYGGCKPNCTRSNYCGDGVTTSPYEDCDNGANNADGMYSLEKSKDNCTSDCSFGSYCGDGIIDSSHGEKCDDGVFANNGAYGGCTRDCQLASHCGDGIVDYLSGEECDNGINNKPSGYGTCNSVTCMWNTGCGDGDINGSEQCDDGLYKGRNARNETIYVGGTGEHGGCNENCTLAPRCGDGVYDSRYEECDLGANNGKSNQGCSSTCTVVSGWDCNGTTCTLIPCGNGKLDPGELCDESIPAQSAYCRGCYPIAGYVCRNGTPACPPEGHCSDSKPCIAIDSLYGDGIISSEFEDCDDGNRISGDGCTNGSIDQGYICPTVNKRCVAAACGDGIVAYGEECDDGNDNSGDGCSARCKREEGYRCDTPGAACTTIANLNSCFYKDMDIIKCTCGDGVVQFGEECDDGNKNSNDGCSSTCKIEPNYQCKTDGGECLNANCGNGVIDALPGYTSYEECDLGRTNNNGTKGCTSTCRLTPGSYYDNNNTLRTGTCGDGILGAGEQCDAGSDCSNGKDCNAGNCGSCSTSNSSVMACRSKTRYCNKTCEIEPIFECPDAKNGWCQPICGDGLQVPGLEECDDGNVVSGDGCSSLCKIEEGYSCSTDLMDTSGNINLPITYRDFIKYNGSTGNGDGYLSQTLYNKIPNSCKKSGSSQYRYDGGSYPLEVGHPIPDFYSYCPDSHCLDAVLPVLGKDGLPDLNTSAAINAAVTARASEGAYNGASGALCKRLYTCPEIFKWWYTDVPGINRRIDTTLKLTKASGVNKFTYTESSFYPINGKGYTSGTTKNGEFSSQFKTYFKYKDNTCTDPVLTFDGDDDVWVFFNRRLGVDVGGIHPQWKRDITLSDSKAATLHMYSGGIYPLEMFHAERCTGGSSFRLTLDGFLPMGTSKCVCRNNQLCSTTCGNGVIDQGEQCDCDSNGKNCKNASGNPTACFPRTCKLSICGDGNIDTANGEECDQGSKNGTKNAYCTSKCKIQVCGDGEQGAGEECDRGDNNEDEPYGLNDPNAVDPNERYKCTKSCKIAPYCGDGIVDALKGEVCDNGRSNNDDAYGDNSCTTECKRAHYCGDGIKDSREKCDKGAENNTGEYGGCNRDCTLAPYCGDRMINGPDEECDNGAANSDNAYGATACLANCKSAPYCGDNHINGASGREQCDLGDENSVDAYGQGKCNNKCLNAGYCGDGIKNGPEECDYGEDNKDGEYGGCSTSCTLNSRCGDGILDEGYETCDDGINDGSYNGCTSSCTKAGYCGDGTKNGPEECDYGKNNQDNLYGGCSKECKLNAYCGDGNIDVSGNEACDNKTENNKGQYGGCNANCTKAPYCGDGLMNGTGENKEECDLGTANNNGAYGGCNSDCTRAPSCGDGIVNGTEACDDGAENNNGEYGGCNANCTKAPYCGDGLLNGDETHIEECDFGKQNNGQYGGCNPDCTLAPFCGDGNVDSEYEECDYKAEDAYMCSPYCRTIHT